MRNKIFILILAIAIFTITVEDAKADIGVSIKVKDSDGNSISGKTVSVGTKAYVYGHYEDLNGDESATAKREVYYSVDGSSWAQKAILFQGTVNDGETIDRTYTMTDVGYYRFKWTCESVWDYGLVYTTVHLVVPEPGTLIGLTMSISALGLWVMRRVRVKQ